MPAAIAEVPYRASGALVDQHRGRRRCRRLRPNGLVAANALADAGWDVLLLEAQDTVGGAVRSAEVIAPGYSTDLFSAFYPLAAASPVIKDLDLTSHGLRWVRAPQVLAHVLEDGRAAVLSTDLATTSASLDQFAAGDGQAWADMFAQWQQIRDPLLDALFTPFPPVKAAIRLLRRSHVAGALDLARLAILPVNRLSRENFRGTGAGLLLTGNALHSDIPPDAAGSGVFGWLLTMLGQDVGYPVPEGGAGKLSGALAARFSSAGGQIRTGARVTSIVISNGRAVGVRCADGARSPGTARRSGRRQRAIVVPRSGRHGTPSTGLRPAPRPIPMGPRHSQGQLGAGPAGAVDRDRWSRCRHSASGRGLTTGSARYAAELAAGRLPERPFMLFGQMTTSTRRAPRPEPNRSGRTPTYPTASIGPPTSWPSTSTACRTASSGTRRVLPAASSVGTCRPRRICRRRTPI